VGNSLQSRAGGVLYALSAGILWGFMPVYIHYLGDVEILEIVAHRSLWSLVLLFLLVVWRQQFSHALQVFANKKLLANFFITTCFLSVNWAVYVYAVKSGHVVSAALGYFIYPICTILLGIAVLDERLDRWAALAACCVTFGVLVKAFLIAGVPWIALSVALTFSLYAVTRKRLKVDPILGLFVETLMLLPVTLTFFGWLAWSGQPLFFGGGAKFILLAMFVGVLTVVPLVLFHAGNNLLSMTTASLLFYSNPTTQLLIATLLIGEVFEIQDLLAFGPIWLGIAMYFATRPKPVRNVLPTG
jgi:chloramphenicol-sensitive protein RarD